MKKNYLSSKPMWFIRKIANEKKERRARNEHLNILQELIAVEFPQRIVTITRTSYLSAPYLLISRNSPDNKHVYVKVHVQQLQEDKQHKYYLHEYKNKVTYSCGVKIGNQDLFNHVRKIIEKHDLADNYKPEKSRKLVNITKDADGNITVTVMDRDEKGRFKAKPIVERGHDIFTIEDFKQLFRSKNFSISVFNKNAQSMIVLKGQKVKI